MAHRLSEFLTEEELALVEANEFGSDVQDDEHWAAFAEAHELTDEAFEHYPPIAISHPIGPAHAQEMANMARKEEATEVVVKFRERLKTRIGVKKL